MTDQESSFTNTEVVSLRSYRLKLLFYTLILASVLGFQPLWDFDVWWHIASGYWMINHHKVPHTDPFSYTFHGSPWIHHEWGTSIILTLLWRYFGYAGLLAFKITLFFGILYFIGRSIQIVTKKTTIPFLSLFGTAFLIHSRVQERPHMFSSLFLSILFYSFYRYSDAWRKPHKKLLFIPVIFVLWANLHWGVILAVGLFFLFWLGKFVVGYEKGEKKILTPLFVVFVLSALAILVNPYFYHVYTFPFEHLNMPGILQWTYEWRSPFSAPFVNELGSQAYMILAGIVIILSFFRWRKSHPEWVLVFVPIIYLSLRHNRYIDIFTISVVPLVSWEITQLSVLEKFSAVKRKYLKRASCGLVMGVLLIFINFGIPVKLWGSERFHLGYGLHPRNNFFKAVVFLKDNGVMEKIFHYFELGGYLMMAGYPVYIDGRTPVYGDDFFTEEYINPLREQSSFERVRKKWDFGVVFVLKGALLAPYLAQQPDWRLVYADDVSLIFMDNRPRHRKMIKKFGYDVEEARKLISPHQDNS